MIDKAIAMALKAHEGKLDLAGRPYILHPLRVAMKFAGSEDLFSAAVLHDVVEDSSVTFAQISKAFNPFVAKVVDALTRREGEDYLIEFIPRCRENAFATLIKIADIEDNLDPNLLLALGDTGIAFVNRYLHALKILKEVKS
jgi:(p)ppGpp synthase/HD superfamily hydrolase